MPQSLQTLRIISRQPSAFLPVTMSLIALTTMLIGPLLFHDLHSTDEGPTAHLWQILIAGQVPVVVFFAFKWLRRAPRAALKVLFIQAGAVLANFALIYFLGVG